MFVCLHEYCKLTSCIVKEWMLQTAEKVNYYKGTSKSTSILYTASVTEFLKECDTNIISSCVGKNGLKKEALFHCG